MKIAGSHILITGGSSGIGKATAKQLISEGANVLITGRDKQKLSQVAQEIGAKFVAFDIGNKAEHSAAVKQCVEQLGGKLDVLVNNAGYGVFPTLESATWNDFEQVFAVNVFGLAMFTKEVLPVLKNNGKGTIINIGSTAAKKGFARGSVYAASKFALRSMTQCWQQELRKDNIRVVQLNPSEVTTAFAQEDREEREEASNKLGSADIAHAISSVITMRDKGFIAELDIWATNPF